MVRDTLGETQMGKDIDKEFEEQLGRPTTYTPPIEEAPPVRATSFDQIINSDPKETPLSWKDTNPKDKVATNRLNLALTTGALEAFASLGMTEGDAKYGGFNYMSMGVSVMTYIAAMKRHITKFEAGEWADPKTHVPHLASMAADLDIMINGFLEGTINDDRPPVQPGLIKFLADSEEIVEHLYSNFNNPEAVRWTQKMLEPKHAQNDNS